MILSALGCRSCLQYLCKVRVSHRFLPVTATTRTLWWENNTFVFLSGTFFLRQGQVPLPSSPLQPLVTPWQRAQCTHHLPGPCQGIPCLGPPSSSRNPPSTARGGKNCLSRSVTVSRGPSVDLILGPGGFEMVREWWNSGSFLHLHRRSLFLIVSFSECSVGLDSQLWLFPTLSIPEWQRSLLLATISLSFLQLCLDAFLSLGSRLLSRC